MEVSLTLAERIDPVAIYAAIVATAILLWDVLKWWTSRPALRLRTNPGMEAFGFVDPYYQDKTFVLLAVTNVGSSPTTLTHIAGEYFSNRWNRLRGKRDQAFIVFVPQASPDKPIPHVLGPGEEWAGLYHQNDELVQMAQQGLLYALVYHSVGKRPARKRIVIPPS